MLLRKLTLMFAAVAAFAALAPSEARADDMDKAMNAVFRGKKELKDVKIKGHGFNIHPAKQTSENGILTISGKIMHRLWASDDDKVEYTVKKDATGRVHELKAEVTHRSVVRKAARWIGDKILDWIKDKLGELVGGSKTGGGSTGNGPTDGSLAALKAELRTLEQLTEKAEEQLGKKDWEAAAAAIVANIAIRAQVVVPRRSRSGRTVKPFATDRLQNLRRAVAHRSKGGKTVKGKSSRGKGKRGPKSVDRRRRRR